MSPLVVMTLCLHVLLAMGSPRPQTPKKHVAATHPIRRALVRLPPIRRESPPTPIKLYPAPKRLPPIRRESPPTPIKLYPAPKRLPFPRLPRISDDYDDSDCDELEKRISALEATVKRQERRLDNPKLHKFAPIAFTAVMSANQNNIHYGKKIIFPDVLLNNGAGYNPKTGVFTAPVTGTYLISVHVLHPNMKKWMHLSVVLHDRTIARIHGTAYMWDGGSQTLIININQGQQLWVQNDRNEKIAENIHGRLFSTFSGVKLN